MRNKRNKNNKSKLIIYILISLLIHFSFLIFFPLANNIGVANSEKTNTDFGFIQVVEYQPVVTQTSGEKGNKENSEKVEEKIDQKEEDKENNTKEFEKNIEEKKDDVTSKENKDTMDNNEEINKENSTNNAKKDNNKNVDEDNISVTKNTNENEKSIDNEIITSEESDTEVNIKNNENSTNQKSENKNTKDQKSQKQSNNEKTKKESPPPPPTSGELIAKSVTPQYPKDLIGEAKKGTVKFLVNIDKTGNIIDLNITDSSDVEKMDRTARLAIERAWVFKSYNLSYSIPITVNFNINEEGNPKIDIILGEVNFKEVSDN